MSLAILFHLLCAQHVSDINISFCRLKPAKRTPPNTSRKKSSNTQRTENKTTDVVIHQHSRKLLKMDILMSETCWAHNKWNKIGKWHQVGLSFINYCKGHTHSLTWHTADFSLLEFKENYSFNTFLITKHTLALMVLQSLLSIETQTVYLLFLDKALFQRNRFPKAKFQNSTCLTCLKISGKYHTSRL